MKRLLMMGILIALLIPSFVAAHHYGELQVEQNIYGRWRVTENQMLDGPGELSIMALPQNSVLEVKLLQSGREFVAIDKVVLESCGEFSAPVTAFGDGDDVLATVALNDDVLFVQEDRPFVASWNVNPECPEHTLHVSVK